MAKPSLTPTQTLAAIGNRLRRERVEFEATYSGSGEYVLYAHDPSTMCSYIIGVAPGFQSRATADRLLNVVRKGELHRIGRDRSSAGPGGAA